MIDNVVDPAGSVSLNCDICAGSEDFCVCPECDECGEQGNPDCIEKHMPAKIWQKSFRQMQEYLERNPEEVQYLLEIVKKYTVRICVICQANDPESKHVQIMLSHLDNHAPICQECWQEAEYIEREREEAEEEYLQEMEMA